MTEKPKPVPTAETLLYWQGGAENELRYTWCQACQKALFPPRSRCACGAATGWRVSSGAGIVHSYTVVERAPLESFRGEVPYTIALVDLNEGFRIMTNLRGGDPRIGARVRIEFEAVGEGLFLPQARLMEAP